MEPPTSIDPSTRKGQATLQIICGDALTELRKLQPESVQCCVTSPPYWGLRDYSANGQLGLEKTPEEYVGKLVEVFREVRRVLRKDGTLWLNLGDSYANNPSSATNRQGLTGTLNNGKVDFPVRQGTRGSQQRSEIPPGLKPKDLCGIPWRVAFALQADGWWLRSDCPWIKRNTMPESTRDRPTKAIEYFFMLTKSAHPFYDYDAVRKPAAYDGRKDEIMKGLRKAASGYNTVGCEQSFHTNGHERWQKNGDGERVRARRNSDWFFESFSGLLSDDETGRPLAFVVNPRGYYEAHFATYPPDLIKPCVLASSRVGDTILDPFAGSGTTGMVALELGRKAILIELNPKYIDLIRQRCDVTPGLALA